ncbi:hypothetical protein [Nocardia arthritidis]|uniref:Uncharacterized protein n=1 Tax=Nocardia arthritidis TaxID=228602 RepID=A0A6G9YUG0_9NOCA|nr:hypothetical protein [Nocardia arthritidis]QIS16757.1 hypothetical protein F5544_44770 [Nocardia arthritidis]
MTIMTPNRPASRTKATGVAEIRPLAVPAIVLGLAMLIAAGVAAPNLSRWAGDFGPALAYLAFALHVSLASLLTWWGADLRRRN